MKQSAEATQVFLEAVLSGDDAKAFRISQDIKFKGNSASTLWILHNNSSNNEADRPQAPARYLNVIEGFFKTKSKSAMSACLGDQVFIFTENVAYPELDEGLEQELVSKFDFCDERLVVFNGLCSFEDIRRVAGFHDDFIYYACKIYPKKHVFFKHDLQFAAICKTIAASRKQLLFELLEPLRDDRNNDVLARTLGIYLLDADSNTQKAGDLMYQHKNTIQYRLHVIRQKLNLDIKKMPAGFNLYLAAGIERLIRNTV